jgi:hypothetical protein
LKEGLLLPKESPIRIRGSSFGEAQEVKKQNETWLNNLTSKSSYWWTSQETKNLFSFSHQNQKQKKTLFDPSTLTILNEEQSQPFFFKTAWICALLFHFCSILSLLSISQIRGLFKFYLLGISKIYKTSLGILEYSYTSLSRFKLGTVLAPFPERARRPFIIPPSGTERSTEGMLPSIKEGNRKQNQSQSLTKQLRSQQYKGLLPTLSFPVGSEQKR